MACWLHTSAAIAPEPPGARGALYKYWDGVRLSCGTPGDDGSDACAKATDGEDLWQWCKIIPQERVQNRAPFLRRLLLRWSGSFRKSALSLVLPVPQLQEQIVEVQYIPQEGVRSIAEETVVYQYHRSWRKSGGDSACASHRGADLGCWLEQ